MDTETSQDGKSPTDSKDTDTKGSKTPSNDVDSDSATVTDEQLENSNTRDESDIEDILILKKDPNTNKGVINRQAYLKLHRASSPTGRSSTILKEKYESNSDIETYLRNRDIIGRTLKFDRLPSDLRKSDIPVPRPRRALVSDSSIQRSNGPTNPTKSRHSYPLNATNSKKDENSNDVLRKNSTGSGEFMTIVPRSDSEGSVDKLKEELDLFTMDEKPKEKKRSNSFRKIFSGKIFSKEKKKKDDQEQMRVRYKENAVNSDNMKNETNAFNRQATHRHTVGGVTGAQKDAKLYRNDDPRAMHKSRYTANQMEQHYAQMHINEFNQMRRNFENNKPPKEPYVQMDKPLITNNSGPGNYTKMGNLSRYIDSSSSVSTLESDRDARYQNEVIANAQRPFVQQNVKEHSKHMRYPDPNKEYSRDTPPRAQELRQDVKLVNPKALIPINSERPLPNPYHHTERSLTGPTFRSNSHHSLKSVHQEQMANNSKMPHFEETYGTVLDSVDRTQKRTNESLPRTSSFRSHTKSPESLRPPRSPSLESTKLRLPANRDIGPLSPRMKSPIPQDNVSTEKIIATELLKPRSPTPTRKPAPKPLSPSHQKLEIAIDYPDNIQTDSTDNNSREPTLEKTPLKSPNIASRSTDPMPQPLPSRISPGPEQYRGSPVSHKSHSQTSVHRISAASPIPETREKITTNAVVHVNSMNLPSPSQTNLNHLRSLSTSIRSITPVEFRTPTSNSSQSPQKEEMRRNLEAYYWKELKKLKEQEDYDRYNYYQMQIMRTLNGYAEDPVTSRRGRSMSPTSHRNSRRSLSLPRDPKPSGQLHQNVQYGRYQQNVIPENRMPPNQGQPYFDFNPNQFRRNTPERRTIDSAPGNFDSNSLYRPIFKRGSLTSARDSSDDGQNKRVSFSNSKVDIQNIKSWPTKNGYTQSPPQRRNTVSGDDEVFLPPNAAAQTTRLVIDGKEIYDYTKKPPTYAEYQQRQNEQQQQSRRGLLAQQRVVYDTAPAKPPRESPYGPLVVANVRQQKPTNAPQEPPYGPLVVANNKPPRQLNSQDESLYNQKMDGPTRVPNNLGPQGSMQPREPLYAQKPPLPRRMSYDTSSLTMRNDSQMGRRREIVMNDDVFGQFGGYAPQNGHVRYQNVPFNIPRQTVGESYYIQQPDGTRQIVEPMYGYSRGVPRQVSVRNQVCDIYGQIHDRENPGLTPAHQRSGVVLGQVQKGIRPPQSYGQLPNETFVRNTRLTASANDMYRRHQSVDPRYRNDVYQQQQNPQEEPPNRPLPPVPTDKRLQNSNKSKSDNALNGSQKAKKNKKRSFFGTINRSSNDKDEIENAHALSLGDLRRLVFLEELQLIRLQKEALNNNHSRNDSEKFASLIKSEQSKFGNQRITETDETKNLKINELKRLVLTEKLHLVRMQIHVELETARRNTNDDHILTNEHDNNLR